MKTKTTALLLCAAAALCGDVGAQDRRGSIYRPDAGPQGAIANKTARRAGDLITVIISETQDVNNQEIANFRRETSLDYQLASFNIKPNAFNPLPDVVSETEDELNGTANYMKKGVFNARLTAIVADALPNGNLVISGRREIRIDQEVKLIEFTGVVRRYDVRADNTIQSELVADARVIYAGSGPLTETTNRRGLARAFVNLWRWLWPF